MTEFEKLICHFTHFHKDNIQRLTQRDECRLIAGYLANFEPQETRLNKMYKYHCADKVTFAIGELS